MSNISCCLPIAFLCNCCQRPKAKQDQSYQLLQVISKRADIADEDDDESGAATDAQGNSRALRKALDDKFKEINTFLSKKVLKSVIDLGQETGTKFEQLEQNGTFMQDQIKNETKRELDKLKDELRKEYLEILAEKIEPIEQQQGKLTEKVKFISKTSKETKTIVTELKNLFKQVYHRS